MNDGLPHDVVMSTYQDSEGTYWFSTRGGLARYRNGRFTTYRQKEGVFHDAAQRVLEDGRGHLWLTSNRGVFRVSLAELAAAARTPGRITDRVDVHDRDGHGPRRVQQHAARRLEGTRRPPLVRHGQGPRDGRSGPHRAESGAAARRHRAGPGGRPGALRRGSAEAARGDPSARVRLHGAGFPQPPCGAIPLSPRGIRQGMGGRGPASHGLLHERASRPLSLPRAGGQRGRRVERGRRRERSRAPAATGSDHLVPGIASRGARGSRRGALPAARPPARISRAPAGGAPRGAARRPAVPAPAALPLQHAQQHPAARRPGPRSGAADGRPARETCSGSHCAPRTRRSSRSKRRSPSSRSTSRSSRSAFATASKSPSVSTPRWPRRGCRASSCNPWSRTRSSTGFRDGAAAETSRSRRGAKETTSRSPCETTARGLGRARSTRPQASGCATRGAASRRCIRAGTTSSFWRRRVAARKSGFGFPFPSPFRRPRRGRPPRSPERPRPGATESPAGGFARAPAPRSVRRSAASQRRGCRGPCRAGRGDGSRARS